MTLLGKIFTVLIFIMSLVFMSFALMVFATHKNWKAAAMNPAPGEPGYDESYGKVGLKKQVEDAVDTNKLLNAKLVKKDDELALERAARRMALQQLQSKVAVQQRDLDDKETQLSAKIAENSQLLGELSTTQARNTALTTQVAQLRDDLKDARQYGDEQFQQVVALTDKLHQNQGLLARETERKNQLANDNAELERVMKIYGLTIYSPTEKIPPKVEGYITKVSTANKNLVEISLGSDDGIRVDHQLDVFRGATYVGRLVVREVDTNAAVAEVVLLKSPIQKDDSVTTKLSS